MNKENGSITLGELANIIFQLLGTDYFENKGISSNIRKRYISEKDISYEKYNLSDKKNELAKEIIFFTDKLIIDFKVSESIKYILDIPRYLSLNYQYFRPEIIDKKTYITWALKLYISFLLQTERISESTLESIFTETYASIIKTSPIDYHIKDLSEQNHTWKTVSKLMEEIIKIDESSKNEKQASEINTKIIRHYLYLNLTSSLKENFQIEGLQENIKNNLDDVKNIFNDFLLNYPNTHAESENIFPQLWNYLDLISKENYFLEKNDLYHFKCSRLELPIVTNFIFNDFKKVKEKETNRKLENISQLKPNYYFLPYWHWMQARTLIFQLEFPLNDDNKEKYEQILKHFEDAFNLGKYVFGKDLGEFLEDAIAAENYLNPKNKIKDRIIENSQDNLSKEISINSQNAKMYWIFGYATGHLSETSKQTYLFAYRNKENFWISFIVNKFISKTALEQKQKDILSEELTIPLYPSQQNTKHILNKLEHNRRNKLSPDLERYYSELSLAIVNIEVFYNEATKKYDDSFLEKIKEMSKEKVSIYDENGATSLIRALYEYKKTRYGFTTEFQKKRADLFSKFHLKLKCLWDDKNSNVSAEEIIEKNKSLKTDFIESYIPIMDENYKNFDYEKNKIKQDFLKEIILILIEKYDSNQLLAEAIELDYLNCVSALQLAIDSYDFELVDLIISKIPQDHKLHEILISNEYLNPLQYAIRKYDLLTSGIKENPEIFNSLSKILREIPNKKLITSGIIEKSRVFNENKSINNLIKPIRLEQTGFSPPSIFKSYSENMSKIIKKLADKTDYISVDTMYYLADANDSNTFEELIQYFANETSDNDVLELAKYIINTKKVDIARSNYDFDLGYFPKDTILANCILRYNFKLLKIILEDKFCSEKLKPTLNQIVENLGWDSKRNFTIVKSTDTDFYFANVCNFFRNYHEYKKHKEYDQKQEKYIIALFKEILSLFYKLGARFDIKDQQGKTTADFIQKRLNEKIIPKELIPKEIIKEYNIKI